MSASHRRCRCWGPLGCLFGLFITGRTTLNRKGCGPMWSGGLCSCFDCGNISFLCLSLSLQALAPVQTSVLWWRVKAVLTCSLYAECCYYWCAVPSGQPVVPSREGNAEGRWISLLVSSCAGLVVSPFYSALEGETCSDRIKRETL